MSINTAIAENNSHWYAIRTHFNQETRAETNLRAWNVESFFPKIKERRRNEFSGAISFLTKPFFPRYLFAKFEVDRFLHKVWFTRGVQSVVNCGGSPSVVDEEIIAFLQTRTNSDGFVQLREDFKPGDKVVMKNGVLENLVGLFERETNDSERVMVLLETINYQGHVIVERDALRKVAN